MSKDPNHQTRALLLGNAERDSTALSVDSRRVLRNTYALLGLTLAFSAAVAGLSMRLGLPHPGLLLTLIGFFGLSFLINRTADSGWGVLSVFALTGFMGYTLGPLLSSVLSLPNGRKCPVWESGCVAICSGVPQAIRVPPWSPPSGPRSMIQSAVLITSRLCSMTTMVLPSSRSGAALPAAA
jgi:hypothetical protein